jgi:hypothetical protein
MFPVDCVTYVPGYRFNTSVTLQVQYIGNGLGDKKLVKPKTGGQADAMEGARCEEPEIRICVAFIA